MIIMMTEERVKGIAKRLRKILRGLGIEFKHFACLELASKLCGSTTGNTSAIAISTSLSAASTTTSLTRNLTPATHSRWPSWRRRD